MIKQTIIILVGISGSGKSTYCTEFIKENPEYIRVNRDSIRQQITSTDSRWLDKHLEDLVTKIQDEQIRTILKEGYNVIIDNTNLQEKYINKIIKDYNFFADIKIELIDKVTAEQAKLRVSERDTLGIDKLDYIDKQFKQLESLNLSTTFYPMVEVEPYKEVNGLDDCIICDLDGTLSLYDHNNKSAYDRDFENDKINYPIRDYLEEVTMWHNSNDEQAIEIFFFSGRNGKFKKQTEAFLNRCFEPSFQYTLVMRDENDFRRDSLVKLDMFDKYIRNKYNVNCVFDDRLQVIEEVWNKLGIFVFTCNQGLVRF